MFETDEGKGNWGLFHDGVQGAGKFRKSSPGKVQNHLVGRSTVPYFSVDSVFTGNTILSHALYVAGFAGRL